MCYSWNRGKYVSYDHAQWEQFNCFLRDLDSYLDSKTHQAWPNSIQPSVALCSEADSDCREQYKLHESWLF